MSLIKYYPGDTFFHKLDPRTKMVWLISIFILAFIFTNPVHTAVLFIILLALWVFIKIPFREMKLFFKALTLISIFTFFIQLIFYPGSRIMFKIPIPTWIPYFEGALKLTEEGLIMGISMVLRLFVIVLSMPLVTMTTSIEKLVLGLIRFKMPYEVAFATTTALNMVPSLQDDARMIMEAQKARAFTAIEKGSLKEKIKAYVPLIIPLMVGAMRKGQQLEIAMESRAFGAYKTRTYLTELKMSKTDYITIVLLLTITLACIILRVTIGFGTLE